MTINVRYAPDLNEIAGLLYTSTASMAESLAFWRAYFDASDVLPMPISLQQHSVAAYTHTAVNSQCFYPLRRGTHAENQTDH